MSMVAGEALASGIAGDTSAGTAGSKFGLTGGQKAGALGRAVPKPKTNHPYIVGFTLVIVGGFALIGSITGTLPSMLAALFVPQALADASGNKPGVTQTALGAAAGDVLGGGFGYIIGTPGGIGNVLGAL